MFLSSYRRPPSSYTRTQANRQTPTTTVSGTSLSKPRGTKQPDPKPAQRQPLPTFNPLPTPNVIEASRSPVIKVSTEEDIIIHVRDEAKKIDRDFKCPKSILIAKMKYFESHLLSCQSVEDLEISVHCDVDIFEWLMLYMIQRDRPDLEITKVISILISSEFLQMQSLVNECLEFMVKNLEEVVKLPIDMSCLNPNLLKQLARMTTPEALDDVKDRKDKLVSKLFMKKLEELLEDDANTLNRCVYCNKLYTNEQHEWMMCEKARIFIDFHGNVIAEHVADRNWEINKFFLFLKEQSLTWREIYWKIWARLIPFNCAVCGLKFVGAELGHCSYHPEEPKFSHGSNIGFYQCCQQRAIRFDTSIKKKGCCGRNHVPRDKLHSKEYELLTKNFSIIEEPFETKNDRIVSINKMIQLFVSKEDDVFESEDEELDEDSRTEENPDFLREEEEKKRKKIKGKNSDLNPRKQRIWKLDHLRFSDFNNMKDLCSNLGKMRRKKENIKPISKKK